MSDKLYRRFIQRSQIMGTAQSNPVTGLPTAGAIQRYDKDGVSFNRESLMVEHNVPLKDITVKQNDNKAHTYALFYIHEEKLKHSPYPLSAIDTPDNNDPNVARGKTHSSIRYVNYDDIDEWAETRTWLLSNSQV